MTHLVRMEWVNEVVVTAFDFNPLRCGQNVAIDISREIFQKGKFPILIQISLEFAPKADWGQLLVNQYWFEQTASIYVFITVIF